MTAKVDERLPLVCSSCGAPELRPPGEYYNRQPHSSGSADCQIHTKNHQCHTHTIALPSSGGESPHQPQPTIARGFLNPKSESSTSSADVYTASPHHILSENRRSPTKSLPPQHNQDLPNSHPPAQKGLTKGFFISPAEKLARSTTSRANATAAASVPSVAPGQAAIHTGLAAHSTTSQSSSFSFSNGKDNGKQPSAAAGQSPGEVDTRGGLRPSCLPRCTAGQGSVPDHRHAMQGVHDGMPFKVVVHQDNGRAHAAEIAFIYLATPLLISKALPSFGTIPLFSSLHFRKPVYL